MLDEEAIIIKITNKTLGVLLLFILILATLYFFSSAQYCDYRIRKLGIQIGGYENHSDVGEYYGLYDESTEQSKYIQLSRSIC